ncbi:patatin-like phospholipase family protein, partial [Pseudomonas stutzeri]|nr:patatin-like phospholipase family protein [Stutzerimonas stutzeri]
MRGVYQTAYLGTFAERISEKLNLQGPLDVGSAFDLIVGTSTGGIVACGLAAGVPLTQMQGLYAKAGEKIFPLQWVRPLPILGKLVRAFGIGTVCGDRALRKTLIDTL